jgi:hypothetical protein
MVTKPIAAPAVDPRELATLVALGERILDACDACDDDAMLRLVDEFNRCAGTRLEAGNFRMVPAAEEIEEFVERVMMLRELPASGPRSEAELITLLDALAATPGTTAEALRDDEARLEHTARALVASSQLPGQLAASFTDDLPRDQGTSAENVAFVIGYRPPTAVDEVWGTARAWASYEHGGRYSPRGYLGRVLLELELARVDVPELRAIIDGLRKIPAHPVAHRQYLERAGLLERRSR